MSSKKADLDWSNLSFGYQKTDFNIRYYYKNGKWSKGELVEDENLNLHIAAPCLHYGQECFEGMKAFETKTGKIVVFRPEENWKRLQKTSERIFIPPMPEKMFVDAVKKVIAANRRFVPPYGTGASLYLRPLIIGTGARVGLGPAYVVIETLCTQQEAITSSCCVRLVSDNYFANGLRSFHSCHGL